jgi:hypothetical protein
MKYRVFAIKIRVLRDFCGVFFGFGGVESAKLDFSFGEYSNAKMRVEKKKKNHVSAMENHIWGPVF